MSKLTSSPNKSNSHTLPSGNSKDFRNASFPSYVDGAEESFVLELRGPHDNVLVGRNKIEGTEIDVLDAKKYFNEGLNNSSTRAATKKLPSHLLKKDEPFDVLEAKEKSRIATPSIRSISSWNSRNSLLHSVPMAINKQPGKTKKISFLSRIGCNCSCTDKNSVDIDDHLVRNGNKCLSLQKKLTWEAIAPSGIVDNEVKITSISSKMDNDSDSDSSSDLFEIESFSKGNPFLSRQASDGMSITSEASVEWSVVTASAVDSDDPEKVVLKSRKAPLKEMPKRRSSFLSGCKNKKAVGVAHRGANANQFFNNTTRDITD